MTKAQVREHLLNAPPGTTPGGIVAALRAQGVQMEGDPQAPQQPGPLGQVASYVGETLGNVPGDTAQVASDLYQSARHPLKTVAGLAKLAVGAGENAYQAVTGNQIPQFKPNGSFGTPGDITPGTGPTQEQQMASAAGQSVTNAVSHPLETLKEHPVSTALTVAPLAGPAAKAAQLGKVAKLGEIGMGERMQGTAERLYQSALKPTQATLNDFPTVVQTGLKNGIVLGKGSIDEVKGMLEDLRSQIDDSIDTAAKGSNSFVMTEDVVTRMSRARDFFKTVPGGSKYVDQLDGLAETFLKEQGNAIPLDKAQTIKKNTYKLIHDSYGDLDTAIREGQKDIARGLKEEIVAKVPEIKGLNLKQQELMGLEKAMGDFVRRTGNRQMIDMPTAGATAVGMATSGVKGAAKAFATGKMLKAFMDDPAFKSWRALVYYRLGKTLPGKLNAGTPARAAAATAAGSQIVPPSDQ